MDLNPNYAQEHEYYSWYLTAVGRLDEAVAEARRAEALDPTSVEISSLEGWWLYYSRQYDQAAAQFRKCLDLDPNYPLCRWTQGQTLEQQGRFDDAIAEERKALQVEPRFSWAYAVIARAYALSGRHSEAQKALDGLLEFSKHNYVPKYSLATVYAALGEKSRALDLLEQSFSERSFFFDFIRSEPEMDSLRSEPRFQELVRRMNFPRQAP